MTELSFLVDLLLNHKLPKATKEAVAKRIQDVEANIRIPIIMQGVDKPYSQPAIPQPRSPHAQAPSTIAALARHPDLMAKLVESGQKLEAIPDMPPPEPVAVIAQTPAAIAAINSRNEAINASMNGKVDKASGRPRKF